MTRLLLLMISLILPTAQAASILIGTPTDIPPFSSLADTKNNFYGFSIDVMGAVCQQMKQKCDFKPVPTPELFAQLGTGKIDLAIAAIIIPKHNDDPAFIYSLPYLTSTAQFLTKQSSSINAPVDINHKKVGVRFDLYQDLARQLYDGNITVLKYPKSHDDLFLALERGDVDVIFLNSESANFWIINNSNIYKPIGSRLPIGEGYAIVTVKEHEALMSNVNKALLAMEANGTYLSIYSRYFH